MVRCPVNVRTALGHAYMRNQTSYIFVNCLDDYMTDKKQPPCFQVYEWCCYKPTSYSQNRIWHHILVHMKNMPNRYMHHHWWVKHLSNDQNYVKLLMRSHDANGPNYDAYEGIHGIYRKRTKSSLFLLWLVDFWMDYRVGFCRKLWRTGLKQLEKQSLSMHPSS